MRHGAGDSRGPFNEADLRHQLRSHPLHLTHLRHKLEPDSSRPRYLITEPGMGYRFLSHRDDIEDTIS